MRQSYLSSIASFAIASAAASVPTVGIYGFENIRRHLQRSKRDWDGSGSIATGNRHGGAHLHQREISRRLRQQARRSATA